MKSLPESVNDLRQEMSLLVASISCNNIDHGPHLTTSNPSQHTSGPLHHEDKVT